MHTYGWDTLAYFALRDDKSFFFSRDGEAFLAYTYIGGYALVAGDPIGRARVGGRACSTSSSTMCDERAWTPALLAVREASMPLYASRGFSAFYLGDEAIIDCRRFTLEGARRKSLRSAVRRVGRTLPLPDDPGVARLGHAGRRSSTRSARGGGARTPSAGSRCRCRRTSRRRGEPGVPAVRRAATRTATPGGFLRVVPAYGPSFGYTLDLMRHDPDAPNGMTEFLIASTALGARDRGVARLSMNFAMWGRLFADDVPFTPAQRARPAGGRRCSTRSSRSSRCTTFNAKFDPEWLPRVLAYRHAVGPAPGRAALRRRRGVPRGAR